MDRSPLVKDPSERAETDCLRGSRSGNGRDPQLLRAQYGLAPCADPPTSEGSVDIQMVPGRPARVRARRNTKLAYRRARVLMVRDCV